MKKLAYILCLALFVYHSQCFCISKESTAFWQTKRTGATYQQSSPKSHIPAVWLQQAKENNKQSLPIPAEWLQQAIENKIDFIYFIPSLGFSLSKKSDIKNLKRLFDEAQSNNIKVVLELPLLGKQILEDGIYHYESATDDTLLSSWNQIATLFKNHAAVVGYSIPTPSRWPYEYDLNLFYKNVVASLRGIDSETPLILRQEYSDTLLDPIQENNILYTVKIHFPHMCTYPIGMLEKNGPYYEQNYEQTEQQRCRKSVKYQLKCVTNWMKQHQVLPQQILITFSPEWIHENMQESYFTDSVSFFNANGWNWSYPYAWVKDEH